jgi:crotonobetainyl-CoA:carnitine CoA-transferase CaiB-like acyl-CoA transferase
MTSPPPLAGLRIVALSLSRARSIAVSSRILADLGAEVLAIMPAADPLDLLLRGIPLMGERPTLDVLDSLLGEADALLVDRGATDWLRSNGIERGRMERLHPALVQLCISPFGLTGPWADLPGGEYIVEAAAGLLMTNGEDSDPPLPAGIPIAALGGGLLGTIALLAALYQRRYSGLGQFIDHAEYDSLIAFSGTLLPTYFLTGQSNRRLGNRHAMAAPWNAYPTRDSWLVICTMNDEQFASLVKAIGLSDLLEDPYFTSASLRIANAEKLDEAISSWSTQLTTSEALAVLRSAGVVAGAINTVAQALDEPHARWRGVVVDDAKTILGPFLKFSRSRLQPSRAFALTERCLPRWKSPRTVNYTMRVGNAIRKQQARPLEGIRLVELGAHTAGPLAGRLLSLLGAEVIKVEPPGGDPARHLAQQACGVGYLFHMNNTDKFGVTLDLATPYGRTRLNRLLAASDVFLTNLAPTTLAAMSLSPDRLARVHPRLIYAGVSGFGANGPRGGEKTFDMVVQALSGVMALSANAAGQPRKIALSVADLLGACSAALGTLAALLERERSGIGQFVDATLLDITMWATHETWKGAPARQGACVATSDGWLTISGNLVAVAQKLANAYSERVPAELARPVDEITAEAAIGYIAGSHSGSELEAACRRLGIAALVPRRIDRVAEAEQTVARHLLVDVDYAGQLLRVIGSPFNFSRSLSHVARAAPELGEHNRLIDGPRP